MELNLIANKQDFKNLKEEWNSLLLVSDIKSIFLTWEWQYTWWKNYHGSNELCIIIAKMNGKVVGISPTYIGKGIIKCIRFIGDEYVDSNYLNFICDPTCKKEVIAKFLDTLSKKGMLYLKYVRSDSGMIESLNAVPGHIIKEIKLSICPVIHLPGSFDDYLNSLSPKLRHNLKRSIKKISELEGFNVEKISSADRALDIIVEINKKKWSKYNSSFDHNFIVFLNEILEIMMESGSCEVFSIKYQDEYKAYYLNFKYGKEKYYYSASYHIDKDDMLNKYSPGLFLLISNIKDAIESKYEMFDMLRGENDYKLKLKDSDRFNHGYLMMNKKNFISLTYSFFILTANKFSYVIERALPDGLKQWLKSIIPKKIIGAIR